MVKFPNNSALLIHLNASVLELWSSLEGSSADSDSGANWNSLCKTFSDKLQTLALPVFFSVEKETDSSNHILALLSNTDLVIKNVEYSHELTILHNLFTKNKFENIVYFDSIYPLLDFQVLSNIVSMHTEYGADYSFGENVPPGIVPPIFGSSIIEALRIQEEEKEALSNLPIPLSLYVEKNLNNFHVEIHYELPDLRMLRLNFNCKNVRSVVLTGRINSEISNGNKVFEQLEGLLQKKPELTFQFPSYIELEIFGGCEYSCSFCFRQQKKPTGNALSLENIDSLLTFVQTGMDDTSVGLGGQGEPLQHQEAVQIIEKFLDEEKIQTVVVETNGLYLEKIIELFQHPSVSKLRFVININSIKNYPQIHGTVEENREKVFMNLEKIKTILTEQKPELLPNMYIQMLKIVDNETEVDDIFELSQNLNFSFLLQKYNSFTGILKEKRVSDMTPLERTFCWHLQRDLYINSDGLVQFCKQSSDENTRGNINTDNISDIWLSQKTDWVDNYNGKYAKSPACESCDEYFTYNF
ncbi:MAG: spiro-SPASM protein [Leptospirales bacterium]